MIKSNYVTPKFDIDLTKKILEELCQITKLNVIVRSKSFDGQTDKTDEWYGTKYSVVDLPDELKSKMTNP